MTKQIVCPAIDPVTQECNGSCDGCYHPDEPATPHEPAVAFHKHLDTCTQCREHVHELCPLGAVLLRRAAGC